MTNTILGAGISGYAYAFLEGGIISSIIIVLVMAIITDYSLNLLVKVSRISGEANYEVVAKKGFGILGYILICSLLFIFSFFTLLAYTIIIGDTIPTVISVFAGQGTWIASRYLWITLAIIFVVAPICMLDNISKLEKFSAISIITEMILTAVVIVEAIIGYINLIQGQPSIIPGWPSSYILLLMNYMNIFGAIGIFSFSFVCHHTVLLLFSSLKKPSTRRFGIVVHLTVFLSACVMLTIGFFGSIAFQNRTQGNILNSLPLNSFPSNLARIAIGMTMVFTIPIEMYVCRTAAVALLTGTILRKAKIPKIGKFKPRKLTLVRILVVILLLFAMTLAYFIEDLGVVLELAGGFCATMVGYMIPAILYLRLASGRFCSRKKIIPFFLMLFGTFCFFCSTGSNLYHIFTGTNQSID